MYLASAIGPPNPSVPKRKKYNVKSRREHGTRAELTGSVCGSLLSLKEVVLGRDTCASMIGKESNFGSELWFQQCIADSTRIFQPARHLVPVDVLPEGVNVLRRSGTEIEVIAVFIHVQH